MMCCGLGKPSAEKGRKICPLAESAEAYAGKKLIFSIENSRFSEVRKFLPEHLDLLEGFTYKPPTHNANATSHG